MNQIITERKEQEIKGIKISRNKDIKTLLFINNQVIVADSENAVQISVYKLERVTLKYGKKISTRKMRTMVFNGRDAVCSDTE
jgi:hypothetical protein